MKAIPAFLFMALLSGCAQINELSDDELATYLETGSRNAVKYALKAALRKTSAADAAIISRDALAAGQIIRANIIPVFGGAETKEVLRSAVDTALAFFKEKITNQKVVAVIDLGVEVIAAEVKLPKNPADKLSERTRKSILGALQGISDGIQLAIPTESSPAESREVLSLPK